MVIVPRLCEQKPGRVPARDVSVGMHSCRRGGGLSHSALRLGGLLVRTFREGRVAAVAGTLVHGTEEDLARGLTASSANTRINTAFVERQNGTDRTYNARKARRTLEFSKELIVHIAVSWWVMLCHNFHHLHRGIRQTLLEETYLARTPAMVKGGVGPEYRTKLDR
ncbi:MAG: hypothetical protein HYV63_31955 [Candidatus Schekmanbacteria bacterium]|nr:hypothetical protein [Candidatus Schekmanbacteria bacterium]